MCKIIAFPGTKKVQRTSLTIGHLNEMTLSDNVDILMENGISEEDAEKILYSLYLAKYPFSKNALGKWFFDKRWEFISLSV